MTRIIPAGMQFWPAKADPLPIAEVIAMYNAGFAGAWLDPEAREERIELSIATGGYETVDDAATAQGWADSFAGQLVIPFIYNVLAYPGCYPGPAQQRGDCVSHATSGACFATIVGDVVGGLPDPQTGNIEGYPEVSAEGIKNNVTSSEWHYWWRGYNGDGWSCDTATTMAMRHGIMLRQAYSDLGIDLSTYSGRLAGKYGAQRPPEAMDAVGRVHNVQTSANCKSREALRDALGNLHGISTCGSEAWSSTRNEHGVSKRSGSWSHGFKIAGFDDRDIIKQVYGESLALLVNNWGRWNHGPRDIYQSAALVPAGMKAEWTSKGIVSAETGNILIPEGAWWCKVSEIMRRSLIAYAGAAGWGSKPNIPHVLI